MSDNRRPWGEETPPPTQKQQSPFRSFIWVVIGLIPAVLILISNISMSLRDGGLENAAFYNRVALAMIVTILIEGVVLHTNLPPGNTSVSVRVGRMILLFLGTGALAAGGLFLIIANLAPYSSIQERLILPALIFIFFAVLSLFSPVMPIWRLDVPDNSLWMKLDSNGHLISYLGPGTRMVRPIDDFAPYTKGGFINLKIDETSFLSQDGYRFRVIVHVSCQFNPLKADESMHVTLRMIGSEALQGILKNEILYIIRDNMYRYPRAKLEDGAELPKIMRSINMDVKELVEARKNMGLALMDSGVSIEPHEMVTEARQRRASVEAMLLEKESDRMNIRINEEGGIYTELKTADETANELGTIVTGFVGMLAEAVKSQQNRLEIQQPVPEQLASPQESPPDPAPDAQQSAQPLPEEGPSASEQTDDDPGESEEFLVVEEDEDGVFRVPKPRRNPIYPDSFDEDEASR